MENKIWFRRKRFGWGWYPVTWQGWCVILLYVAGIFSSVRFFEKNYIGLNQGEYIFIPHIVVLTIFLIIICYKTGESPRWQWGNEKKDNNVHN